MNYLEYFSGSGWLSAYFRMNGGDIGKHCCLYPAGADPYMPEPDLVTIGDHSVIDSASIVCHLNTKGNFALKRIRIGRGCTLRSQSRVQQAVHMGDGSMLLEKSLAMTGEVIEERTIWQGCPAGFWKEYHQTVTPEESFSDDGSISNDQGPDTKTSRAV